MQNITVSKLIIGIWLISGGLLPRLAVANNINNIHCAPAKLPESWVSPQTSLYLVYNQARNWQLAKPANWRRIESYQLLAGGQFTVAQLAGLAREYPQLIDLDLRSEFHGFVNNYPVSYKALPNNDINRNKSTAWIIQHEELLFNPQLTTPRFLHIYPTNLKQPPSVTTRCVTIANPVMISESLLCRQLNLRYVRIAVLDHREFSPVNLDALVAFFDAYLATYPQQWVYLHCQGGAGRTTAATAALLMLKQHRQGKLQSFTQIIQLTEQLSNNYRLRPSCLKTTSSYRCQGQWQRYRQLQRFYAFVKARHGQEQFSHWLITHAAY
jgi:predicted protein tyrosine phosphatase